MFLNNIFVDKALFTQPAATAGVIRSCLLLYAAVIRVLAGVCKYTVDRKKRGSTFDIITLEKHARFL